MIVRDAAGPATVRTVGQVLGLPVEVGGKLEPLRLESRCGQVGELAHLENAANSWSAIVLRILPYHLRGTSPASKAMIARWTRSRASSLANRRAT